MCYIVILYIYIYIYNYNRKDVELWTSLLETPRDVNQLNYKILSNLLFYTPIDYVVGLHNIHVIYGLNYTRNDYIIYMLYKF